MSGHRPEHADTVQAVSLVRRYNKNQDMNEARGLEGLDQRFVATNGGVSPSQLLWLEDTIRTCRLKGKRALVASHLPIHPSVAEADSLAWNSEEILKVVHGPSAAGRPVVAAVLSGHDRGGYCRDEQGVHHVVVEALVECCPPLNAYGILEVHADKLVLQGTGVASSYTMTL